MPKGKLYGKMRYMSGEWEWETRETSETDCRDCLYFNRYDGICKIDVYKENLWDYCEYFVKTGAMTLKEIRDRFAKQEGSRLKTTTTRA